MVNAAEADIISPAVAAEDPNGLLGKILFVCKNLSAGVSVNAFKSCNKSFCCGGVCCAVVYCVKICICGSLDFF